MATPALQTARVEALLRERKLDRTLTTALPATKSGPDRVAAFDLSDLDARLLGGIPRGHVSELVGPVSSGRTSLAWTWLGAATRRGESVALIDTFDRFDPVSGAACGLDLSRLLWVRGQAVTNTVAAIDPVWLPGVRAVEGPGTLLERTIDRALKSLNLVLQSGVCTAVVMDLADVPQAGIRRIPPLTWLRLQRVVEGSDTACLLLGAVSLSRSAWGVTLQTGARVLGCSGLSTVAPSGAKLDASGLLTGAPLGAKVDASEGGRWAGTHDRARRLAGVQVAVEVSSPRRVVKGTAVVDTTTRHDAWAID